MANFDQLLNKPLDEVKRPPAMPPGTYFATVHMYEPTESMEKKTPGVKFTFNNLQPGPDIDPRDLVDADGTPINLATRQVSTTFWLTPDSEYRLKDFVESLGVNTKGRTWASVLPDTMQQAVILDIIQRPNKNRPTDPPFAEVREVKGAK